MTTQPVAATCRFDRDRDDVHVQVRGAARGMNAAHSALTVSREFHLPPPSAVPETRIERDDLSGPEIAAFLEEHVREMRAVSPPESKHALDLAALRRPEISFWIAWRHGQIAGCCALKQLDARHGELKSMRTSARFRRQGIAASLLTHVIREAKARGYDRLSLETGAMDFFAPARRLYRKFGFTPCAPFSSYREDPNSAFFSKSLGD